MKELIYGKNTIYDCLISTNRISELFLLKKDFNFEKIAKKKNIKLVFKNYEFFKKIKGNHQGYGAKVKEYVYQNIDKINKYSKDSVVIVLDQIKDPHNFGAIIRTAVAVGVDAIIISKRHQVDVTPTVEKISVGAINHIDIIKVINISETLKKLKSKNYWMYASSLQKQSQDYRKLDYQGKIVLVIGSEDSGIRPLVLKQCDHTIMVPILETANSLNASVAFGILVYQIFSNKNPI